MIKFYSEEESIALAKRLKITRAVFYSLIVLLLGGYAIMCIFMNYARRNILVPVSCVYAFLATAIVMFVLCYFLLPDKMKRIRIERMNLAYKHKLTGEFTAKSQLKTLRRDIIGYEITFVSEGKQYILYLEENATNFEFENKIYDLELSDNFIVNLKEHQDE